MAKKPTWRIYYDDGTTFDSNDGLPHEAPPRGFILVVGYDETNTRYIMQGWDHYCFDKESDQWWGMDVHGLIDRLCLNKIYAYKLGRTVRKTVWQELLKAANNDPDFPR